MSAGRAVGVPLKDVEVGGIDYPLDAQQPAVFVGNQNTFPDSIVIGEPSRVTDQSTASIIFSNAQGGMGEYEYEETQGITTFTDSTVDTRYQKSIVMWPALNRSRTWVASYPAAVYAPVKVEWLGINPASQLLAWAPGGGFGAMLYNATSNAWYDANASGPTPLSSTGGFARFNNRFVLSAQPGGTFDVYASSDGGNLWLSENRSLGPTNGPLVAHDNKLWYLQAVAGVTSYFWVTTALLEGSTVWTQKAAPVLSPGEAVSDMLEWRDQYGRPAIYAITSRRILAYDDDSDVWRTFYDFSHLFSSASIFPQGHVWRRDGNLYVVFYTRSTTEVAGGDSVMMFTGSVVDEVGPNKGGIPEANKFSFTHLVGGEHWLYGFAVGRQGTTNVGRVLAMNDQRGWHSLNQDVGGEAVIGGGYGNGQLWTITKLSATGGTWYEQLVPDVRDLPVNATGRAYLPASYTHDTAWTDGGTPNVPKRALFFNLDCRNGDVNGLPTGATVKVEYRVDGATAWTSLTTFTASSTFPARASFPTGGTRFNRVKFRLTLTRGTATTATPNIAEYSLNYIRTAHQKHIYRFRVDLRDEAPAMSNGRYKNRSAAELRKLLLAATDTATNGVTTLTYGAGGAITTVRAGDLEVNGVEDSGDGIGRYDVTYRSLETPSDG